MSLGDSGFLHFFRVVSNDYGKPCEEEDDELEDLFSLSGDEPEPQAPKGKSTKKDKGDKKKKDEKNKNGKKKDEKVTKTKGKKAEAWLCPLYLNGLPSSMHFSLSSV